MSSSAPSYVTLSSTPRATLGPTPTNLPDLPLHNCNSTPPTNQTNSTFVCWPDPINPPYRVCHPYNNSYTWPCCKALSGQAGVACGWVMCLTNVSMDVFSDCVDDLSKDVGDNGTWGRALCTSDSAKPSESSTGHATPARPVPRIARSACAALAVGFLVGIVATVA